MPTVQHFRVQQGFRPFVKPALGGVGLGNLGDNNTFSGCVQGYDSESNPVPCSDPSAVVWMDANGNAVAAGTPVQASPAGEAPTGAYLTYNGTWSTTAGQSADKVMRGVLSALQGQGLQVVNSSYNAGFGASNLPGYFTFTAQLQLRVTGPGFNRADDARSIVDHAVYVQTGTLPRGSMIFVSGGTATAPSAPPSNNPPPSSDLTTWLESNAWWLGLGVLAVAIVPGVIKKL